MKKDAIQKKPVIPVRQGLKHGNTTLEALEERGIGLVTFGLEVGDTFEFPDSAEDCELVERQVRKDSDSMEVLVLGLKNGKPAYLSLGNLRRLDADMKPVHPVAAALNPMANDRARLEYCFGKQLTAKENAKFMAYVWDNGVRTDEKTERTVAKLEFV